MIWGTERYYDQGLPEEGETGQGGHTRQTLGWVPERLLGGPGPQSQPWLVEAHVASLQAHRPSLCALIRPCTSTPTSAGKGDQPHNEASKHC